MTPPSPMMHKRPFEAYNYAAKGLSITSLAQIERLAAVRLPDTGMIKDDRDTHHPDGRIAMAWKNGDREISLNEGCLISFQDKFFTIEMAVILHAVNKTRPRYPFTILGYDRKRYVFDDREVSLLLAKLADFFTSQLPLSVPEKEKDDRLQLPTIVLTKPLDDIPEGLAGLGERQLFAMIENTRFGTYKRDPTNVERRLRRSEGQTRASAPPGGRRGRSPTAADTEPKAKAGRGRSASPFVGHGRGRSSSARQPSLIETDQPGVLLARPPPPPPVRHVTEYISAEEWDAIRAPESGHAVALVTTLLLLQHRREGSRPQQRHREVTTTMASSSLGFRTSPGLQAMCRLVVSSRFVIGCCRFWTITFRIMILISGIRSLTTAPATSTHLDDLAPMATHALRAIFGQS